MSFAKIVYCGEHSYLKNRDEATRRGGLKFLGSQAAVLTDPASHMNRRLMLRGSTETNLRPSMHLSIL